ncbi:Acyl-CoA dehydrogenase/oxidase C-terminal [Syntrophomonas zehnderi OL-4]|uniref:Acyl-CoA dehydrogenase/oxidase C-terminal n=1 Tax=Syntrophomonas zehnderi OL-4 TaxID=690567 RepID=A0A0E4C9I4_9FIRM|nr:acyl-CoA dehydrogenase family protein [Syntrophomonas zehnderi]CFY01425.1 Acyl-CoA dehydrogenase/oxidase C-terminal [Syntrophomonas zehnderi OL-4]
MSANFAYLNARDLKFILKEWLPTEEIFAYPQYADYYSKEDLDSVLDPCLKMAKELIEPSNEDGDSHPCQFANGKVITPPTFGPLFHKLQEEGWGTSNIDDSEDAMVLPKVLLSAVWEMFLAANPTFLPYIILTCGAAELIRDFATEEVKEMFLPKMMDGSWSGTMCLTEPSAGSDVGDILSKAYPTDNPRIFRIKGSKMFITGGDNDFTENIVHLYLARIEGAKPGTKGISLFVVPKYWVNEDGSLSDNDVQTTGIEHKLGMYGSVTASLSFGENNGCRGWLLGANSMENDGVGEGMAQMFQMMNGARMETGHSALACIANAYYNARDYCKDRIQGRLITDPKSGRVTIINHEDIKRTLLMGKAHIEAMRAMMYRTYFAFDIKHNDLDPEKRQKASNLIEVTTPLCKAYPSDEAWWLIGEAIQAYGGYGYCEEYPVAQIARDVKIYSIWEGTNFIQSMDLVGRKWMMGKGAVFAEFLQEMRDFCEAHKATVEAAAGGEAGLPDLSLGKEFAILERALESYSQLQMAIGGYMGQKKVGMLPLYARRILTATSQLYAGRCILDQAVLASRKAQELGPDHYDYNFYIGKIMSAKYYLRNVVPNVWAVADIIKDGDCSALDIPIGAFDY